MDLFELILSPFILIIEHLFLLSYKLMGSYGTAIILLSLFISLLLLPIFIYIEKAKKKDDLIKHKMEPLIDEIKRVYKGQERFYYLKTINRQFQYSPFRALIPILSLLLQIPFFIAAYQYLESFTPLIGQSFLFINDLSKADALFGSINILPIAMTIVNLLTAFFYTRNGDTKERKQMLVVAGIFLALLFNLPSGLVLYWTMNNVFSFLRLFITNPEVFKKNEQRQQKNKELFLKYKQRINVASVKLKSSYLLLIIVCIIIAAIKYFSDAEFNTIPWLINFIAIGSGGFLLLSVLIISQPIVEINSTSNLKTLLVKFWSNYKAIFILILTVSILIQVNWALKHTFDTIFQRILLSLIISFATTWVIASIVIFYQGQFGNLLKFYGDKIKALLNTLTKHISIFYPNFIYACIFSTIYFYLSAEFYYNSLNNNLKIFSLVSLTAAVLYILTFAFKKKIIVKLPAVPKVKKLASTYMLSAFYITSLIFFWSPLIVYSSFPETFSLPAVQIFSNNYLLFLISLGSLIILYFLLPKRIKLLSTFLLVSLSFIFFINSLIIPINVGTLQLGQYIKAANLAKESGIFIIEALSLIGTFFLIRYLLQSKYIKHLRIALIAITLIVLNQSLITAMSNGDFFAKTDSDIDLPNTISFSTEHENIIYIIPDMFMGYHMWKIIEDYPELKEELNGFVWYPNTLSVSTNTSPSISSLLAGPDYNIDKLNIDDQRTMAEKITEASEVLFNKAKTQDYRFTGTKMIYSKIDKKRFDAYIPIWHNDWNAHNQELNIGGLLELDFDILWKNALFYGSPLAFKAKIYDNGNWIHIDENVNWNSTLTKDCNFVRTFPHISDTLSNSKNLIYIHSKATHVPWNIIENGELTQNVAPIKNQKWFLDEFVKWIHWMKKNKVYDNTKIVMVSDHSLDIFDHQINTYGGKFKWENGMENLPNARDFWRVNALLMVKDFEATDELKTDWRLMTNSDAPAIIFNENDPTKTEQVGPRTVPVFFVGYNSWTTSKKTLDIPSQYMVTDSIYDPKNWRKIE